MKTTASSGNRGERIRSDCFIEIELKKSGNIQLDLKSKVASMYGESIRQQVEDLCSFYNVKHALIHLEDSGALPFVIAARLESVLRAVTGSDKDHIIEIIPENQCGSDKDRHRQTRLYLPGNTPSMMINAGVHGPHGVILDLEDSVAPAKKDEARILVRNALRQVNFYGAERMVRINQLPLGLKDLEMIAPHHVNLVLVPKCEDPSEIKQVERTIEKVRKEQKLDHKIYLMPIIESCLGVENAYRIASASENVVAMAIGLEDYTADLGVSRSNSGEESLYARTRLVNACKAAGIQAIDSVFSDVDDTDALAENVRRAKAIGFEGMGCIHPRQIQVIHRAFMPSEEELEKARKIVEAYVDAKKKGLGVVALGSKMIDAPVVKRAQKILNSMKH